MPNCHVQWAIKHNLATLEGAAVRSRACLYLVASAPLAVSGPRGVACVWAGIQRALLYDMEEHEGSEDGDDSKAEVPAER